MSRWTWVVYDKLDLALSSPLGVLSDAEAKHALVPWDGPGSGDFVINRHSSQAAWAATRNYITVHIGTESDPAVFGFFIEEGQDEIVSAQEEGGEDFKRGGRGALVYLERAIVDHIQRTANAFTIDADKMNLVWTDKPVGRIFRDLVDEAQARTPNPLPDLTVDFTNTHDSNGDLWDIVDDEFNVPIGLDLLSAIETLKGQGLSVIMDPDFTLHGYQDWTPPSSGVTFEKAVNIREAAAREVHATTAKSRMLVQGTRKNGTTIYKTTTDPSVIEDEGVFEGFMRYNRNATTARLEKAGRRRLVALKRMHDGTTTVAVTVGDGTAGPRGTGAGHYVPFTDYDNGETVTLEVPGEYESLVKMLGGIELEDTEAGEYDVAILFDVPDYNPGVGETQPGGGGPSGGPPFADEPPGAPAPLPPAPTESVTGSCVSGAFKQLERHTDPGGNYAENYGTSAVYYAGSSVYYNEAYTVTGCPIGGGGWTGWSDQAVWVEFTAPADSADYFGLRVTIDLSALVSSGGYAGGFNLGLAQGVGGASRWGQGAPFGHLAPGSGATTFDIPRNLVAWGAANSLVIEPDWLCCRECFFCNSIAYFGSPATDGRGESGTYHDFGVSTFCPVRFLAGTSGLSGWVSGYGAVDGTNATFTLIDWDGTGTVEASINGLIQPNSEVTLDATARTARLDSPPPLGAVVLFLYKVAA